MSGLKTIDVSTYQREKKGNYYCGDSYYYYQEDDYFICALADGLGSGELAYESSQAVMDVIKDNPWLPIDSLIKRLNQVLIGKRGVVLGILRIDLNKGVFKYASIGNIGLMAIASDGIKKRNIPMSGYLGSYPREIKKLNGFLTDGMMFVLFSDGVLPKDLTHDLFQQKEPSDITAIFEEKMDRNLEDDTTLIVIKCP